MSGHIILPASFTADAEADPRSGLGTLSAWCPHCERLHHHGAAGRGAEPRVEKRGAHCDPTAGAPAAGRGYTLTVEGAVAAPDELMPSAPMARLGHSLHAILAANSRELRRVLLLAVIDSAGAASLPGERLMGATLGDAELLVMGEGAFWNLDQGVVSTEGRGLLRLLAQLFGITPGIAGRRVLETMAATSLPAEAALEIEALIDRWTPGREVPK
jgi:hypothetical protein